MEQLWYTSCRNGLGSGSGNMPRAASRGLKDLRSERYARLSRFLRYNLPARVNPNTARPEDAPRNLALLDTGKERILLHQIYVGLDYTGMRYGNHFSHLLVDVPKEVTARDAIDLWRSPFWAEREDRIASGVYELPLVEKTDFLPGELRPIHLDRPDMQAWLRYVIHAYLTLPEGLRFYIVAPSEIVAKLIWGLSHCLPNQLIAGLTFVTYTDNVQGVEAQIIGTGGMAGSTAPSDLPKLFYTEKGRVLNCYTDQSSVLPVHPQLEAYLAHAIPWLARADLDLKSLLDLAEANPAWRLQEFLQAAKLFVAVTSPAGPALSDLAQLLDQPEMAASVLDRSRIQEALLGACADLTGSEPGKWWGERGGLALNRLMRYTDRVEGLKAATQALVEPATRTCQATLREGNVAVAERIYNEALLALVRSDGSRALDLLVNGLRPSDTPDLQARVWLLRRAAEVWSIDSDEKLAVMRPWLEAPWHELGTVLDIAGIPQSWQVQAIKSTLNRCEPSDHVVVELVSRYPQFFQNALAELARKPETVDCAERLFAAVARGGGECKLSLLLELVHAARELPEGAVRRHALLETAALTAQETIQLARQAPAFIAEPGIAHQLVEHYLQLVANEDWSAWLPLLENPHFVANLLGPERAEIPDRLLAGISRNPEIWMRGGQSQVRRLAEATEPAPLHSILEDFAKRALPQALEALNKGNSKVADVLFDQLIRPWSADAVRSLECLVLDSKENLTSEDDSEEGWERRKWLLRRAYELRQGASSAALDRYPQIVTPLLQVSHFGLIRLTVFLLELQGRPTAPPNSTLLPFVSDSTDITRQWLSIAEGELTTSRSKVQISEMNRKSGLVRSEDLQMPHLGLQAQELQSVRKNIERFIEQFKAASKEGKFEIAYFYFTIICQADDRQRVPLLVYAESARPNDDRFIDNLLAHAGLMIPVDGTAYKPDMTAIEEIFTADTGKAIIRSLGEQKNGLKIVTAYLQSLDVATCTTPGARTILEQIKEHPEQSNLLWLRGLADFWFAVADVQARKANVISHVCSYMTGQLLTWLGNDLPTFWRVIDLLVDSAHVPKDLVRILKHGNMLQQPTLDTNEKLGRFSASYHYFLTKGGRSKPADEAARLLPFALIALDKNGNEDLTSEDVRTTQKCFEAYLGDTNATTVQELKQFIERYADEEKKPELLDAWREMYEKLPKELRIGIGLWGRMRSFLAGKPQDDEQTAKSSSPVDSSVGPKRPFPTVFVLHKVREGGKGRDRIIAEVGLRQNEVKEVYNLCGNKFELVQAQDFVVAKVKELTSPLKQPLNTKDIVDKLGKDMGWTNKWANKWRVIIIDDPTKNLLDIVYPSGNVGAGPSHNSKNKSSGPVPWQTGDILLVPKSKA